MSINRMLAVNEQNYFHRYLGYASFILTTYDGTEPFHLYLKKYFSGHKKHGSRDRKYITALCYNFFRLGSGALGNPGIEDKLLLATFLPEKLLITREVFDIDKLFPLKDELSAEVDGHEFSKSFLQQPKLFIRIRPGYYQTVIQKLNASGILYENMSETCLSFANNTKVSEVIKIDEEAVIQDYNSQRVGEFFQQPAFGRFPVTIWDCCAASGGKSILVHDVLKDVKLTVSDTRKSILKNLHVRFAKAGIKNYHSFIADLSADSFNIHKNLPVGGDANRGSLSWAVGTPPTSSPAMRHPIPIGFETRPFDLIIADVPCSGSGTWARTPEQLKFFRQGKITQYVLLQQQIVSNAIPFLAKGGYLLYITCSVFKKENEENVNFIQKKLNLQLIKSDYLKGYQMQADTLFAALFRK